MPMRVTLAVERVGAVRRRIPPAGKSFREGVIPGADIFDRDPASKPDLEALLKRLRGAVIELVAPAMAWACSLASRINSGSMVTGPSPLLPR